jgi:transposase-like protein
MFAEGNTKASIARLLRVSQSTVYRWLEKAARHACDLHDAAAPLPNPVEVQLDELYCRGAGAAREDWIYSSIEVWSRFWTTLHVGRRTKRNTLIAVRLLSTPVPQNCQPVMLTTDPYTYYEACIRRVYGTSPHVYRQVKNTYARRGAKYGIRKIEQRIVFATSHGWASAQSRNEDSKKPNTAFIERLPRHTVGRARRAATRTRRSRTRPSSSA